MVKEKSFWMYVTMFIWTSKDTSTEKTMKKQSDKTTERLRTKKKKKVGQVKERRWLEKCEKENSWMMRGKKE